MAATYPGARSERRLANSDKERLGTAPQPRTDVRQVDAAEKENSNDEYESR